MSTAPYLDVNGFKGLTLAPASYVDTIETREAGWTLRQLTLYSSLIDARLGKRYATPFAAASPPTIVTLWLTRLVTPEVYKKRGVDPTDTEIDQIIKDRDQALAEIKEAADAKDGLFELPLRADNDTVGVTRGAPLGSSEQSPYIWAQKQWNAAQDEGFDGSGN